MKRFLLLVICLLSISLVKAQDIIVLKNADEIQAKVQSIGQNEVSYRKWSNLEGPIYTLYKSQILFIKYANGEKEIFSAATANKTKPATVSNNAKVKFQGYTNVGTIFDAVGGGPTLDIGLGSRIFNHFYVGGATGFHTYFAHSYASTIWLGYIPIGVNLKGFFTKNRVSNPYVESTLGCCIFVSNQVMGGFHCQAGAGVEIKRFSIGIGYNGFIVDGVRGDSGYIKLGVRFGE